MDASFSAGCGYRIGIGVDAFYASKQLQSAPFPNVVGI
jgi:hypothetical protein